MTSKPRWMARVTYKGNLGPIVVDHAFEELHELHDIIERGPSWDALLDIVVWLQRPAYPGETIESAEAR